MLTHYAKKTLSSLMVSQTFIFNNNFRSFPWLRANRLKYFYHLLKYLSNALMPKPEKHLKIAHLLFPFYLTDWITVSRLKKRGLRVVLTVHNVFPHTAFSGGKIDMTLLRKLYKGADLLFVHGDSLREELMEFYSIDHHKIKVVQHGYFDMPKSSIDMITLKRKYSIPLDKKYCFFSVLYAITKGWIFF